MIAALHGLRSSLGLLVALLSWLPGAIALRLVVVPLIWLRPAWRRGLVSWFMKGMSRGILAGLWVGGARFRREGTLDTTGPVVIVMNHQSLVDICTATVMSRPYVPAFVTRSRYARFIPLVSASIRLLDCPIVDPRRDRTGAVAAVREGAARLRHGLLIFPEGHRSVDGELRPFRTAGLEVIFRTRQLPVYVVVTDGAWVGRRFVDFLLNVHRIRGQTEVLGPFESPGDPEAIPAFIEALREKMATRLVEMRERRRATA